MLNKIFWKIASRFIVQKLLAVYLFSLALSVTAQQVPNAAATDSISPQVMEQIAAIGREKDSWTPTQQKISSKLLLEKKRLLKESIMAGVPNMRSSVEVDTSGSTLVDINANVNNALLKKIQDLGGKVLSSFPEFNAIRAEVPIAQLEALASDEAVKTIRPADKAFLNKQDVSQGVVAHCDDLARASYDVDGTGIKVGVLSDSANPGPLATLQASGDLPAVVNVLAGKAGPVDGTDEGLAMLEIVYDMAPGAPLYFATAYNSQAEFAANIIALQQAGCKVIVDDVGYFAEPVFQDGVVAQAVETVTARGVSYFSSAGNSGNKDDGTSGVWEGNFVAMAGTAPLAGSTVHNFGGGTYYDTITKDSYSIFSLQWSDPMGASSNDYDLYLLNPGRTIIVDSSF